MSTQIRVKAWNGGPHKTTDAVTIGDLAKMMGSLLAFGYTEETPVAFLFDDDHVWLETVDFDEEPHVQGFRDLKTQIPRIVDYLTDDETGAEWIDGVGDRWRYHPGGYGVGGWRYLWRTGDLWLRAKPTIEYGPYTEVIDD